LCAGHGLLCPHGPTHAFFSRIAMPKPRKPKQTEDGRQMVFNLFVMAGPQAAETGGAPEETDFDLGLRRVLKQMLADLVSRAIDPLDRAALAERLTKRLGRQIGPTQIDQWVAPSQIDRRLHADGLFALTKETGDMRALQFVVEACGMRLLAPREAGFAQFGALTAIEERLKKEKRKALDSITDQDVDALLARVGGGGA
jgi:hypothetical protein